VPSPAAAQTVFAIARNRGISVVPVTSPFFGQPFQTVVRNVIATDQRGVMFRLPLTFFNNPAENVAAYLIGLAGALEVGRDQVDILIDLQYRPNVIDVSEVGAYCINNLPFGDDWRTVTLASGCFPNSISNEPIDEWIPFQRSDWLGWRAVVQQRAAAQLRLPTYGDYGVRCGGEPVVIPNTPAPNIRYTDDEIIWVRKGTKLPGVMGTICTDLVNRPYFRGAQFSQGDADIAQRAATTNPANGSPEQWIQWCTNHHLELTVSQIQNLP
jgi:hypothetical protein